MLWNNDVNKTSFNIPKRNHDDVRCSKIGPGLAKAVNGVLSVKSTGQQIQWLTLVKYTIDKKIVNCWKSHLWIKTLESPR